MKLDNVIIKLLVIPELIVAAVAVVVAEAVRNLAHRSSSAAKDITQLIHESVGKTENGSKIADRSSIVLKEIVSSIKKISALNNEISSASSEQANGIGQISRAMNELDRATQNNAEAASVVAKTADEVLSQSSSLQELVMGLTQFASGQAPTFRPMTGPDESPARLLRAS
jgi:methyl-accepting chemotaxis protein